MSGLTHTARSGSLERLKAAIEEQDVDVNEENEAGETALSAISGDPSYLEKVTYLIDNGANVDLGKEPPLCVAAAAGCSEILRLLVDRGANVNIAAKEKKTTPLFLAAQSTSLDRDGGRDGYNKCVEILLDNGAALEAEDETGCTPLHGASCAGNLEIVKLLVEKGANLETYTKDLYNPLTVATYHQYFEVVRVLLEAGADVNNGGGGNTTPLETAISVGCAHIAKMMVEHGADPGAGKTTYSARLHDAVSTGKIELVRMLLDHGWNPNGESTTSFSTPLAYAAQLGHKAIVKLLLERGADPATRRQDGLSPMALAAEEGYLGIMRLLYAAGAGLDSPPASDTPLHVAIDYGHFKVVKFLLRNGLDVDAKNARGQTALHRAVLREDLMCVKMLLRHGADLGQEGDECLPLNLAAKSDNFRIVAHLLRAGADPDKKDSRDRTAIWTAWESGHKKMVRLLQENGARLKPVIPAGLTRLAFFAQRGYAEVADVLLNLGSDVNAKTDKGETPLFLAARSSQDRMVDLLLRRGADLSISCNGSLPLHVATHGGRQKAVESLLKRGAALEARNEAGETALQIAITRKHGALITLFLNKGACPRTQDRLGRTALFVAASVGKTNIAKRVLEMDPDAFLTTDCFSRSPLHYASSRGQYDMVKLLLRKDLELAQKKDMYGSTPLCAAVRTGQTRVVSLLLQAYKPPLETVDFMGQTLDHWLARCGTGGMKEYFERENPGTSNLDYEEPPVKPVGNTGQATCDACMDCVRRNWTCESCMMDLGLCDECVELEAHCWEKSHSLSHISPS